MAIHKQWPALVLFALFAVSVALGFFVAEHRYKALAIGNLDYAMYLEFNVRVFDPSLSTSIATNSYADADNMFFRRGPDGAPTMWNWVHFEPITVAPAFLYALTHSILASFGFYIVMFFLFLLYGGFLVWRHSGHGSLMVAALLSLAVFPSTFFYATGDLRAFYIIAPMFICFFLSLLYRRPLPEKILFLSLFLLVREEALLLALAALIWDMLRARRDGVSGRDNTTLWFIWALWAAITLAWDLSPGYTFNPPLPISLFFPVLGALAAVGIALLWGLWRKGAALWPLAPDAMFALSALAPVSLSLFVLGPVPPLMRIIYGRYGIMLFYVCVAALLAYLFDHYKTGWQKKAAVVFLSLCAMLSIASEAVPHASSTFFGYVPKWDAAAQDEQLVYRAADSISTYTPVLLDSTTIIAFYDHDNTYAYNYLPNYLFAPQGSVPIIPYDEPRVKKLISSQEISYAVLLNADAQPLLNLLAQAGKKTTLVESNDTFSFYRIK